MKRLGLLLAIIIATVAPALAQQHLSNMHFTPERLQYKVMFKWGLINKQAGTAVLTLTRDSLHYYPTLTARSAPWADRIFRVRDTLIGRMDIDGLVPRRYEKIANEGDERKHDVVVYDYTRPGLVHAACTRRVEKNGRLHIDEQREMDAETTAVDMLTSFYYMRSLPFADWRPGQQTSVAIFSGKQKETLTLRYAGIETVDVDGSPVSAYHITFLFTSKGGTKTSDDMDAWISTDNRRIPLRLTGKLPVGRVNCILQPATD